MDGLSGAKVELEFTIQSTTSKKAQEKLQERLLKLKNAEVEAANRLNFYLGAVSQTEEFMFRSESRAPVISQEYDFGFMVVPDLNPLDKDLLNWEVKEEHNGQTTEEESEEDEGGADGDLELSGEPTQRSADPGPIQRSPDGK